MGVNMDRERKFFYLVLMSMGLTLLFGGCGGGGGSSGPPSKASIITGVLSDGPIKNARVFLDLNNNGKYDAGEPFSITDAQGIYRIEYILASGSNYLLVAEGSPGLKTQDPWDNPGDGEGLTFTMFFKLTSSGTMQSEPVAVIYNRDLNPVSFKAYLREITDFVGASPTSVVQQIIASNATSTTIFKELIKSNHDQIGTTAALVGAFVKLSNQENGQQATTLASLAAGSAKTVSNPDLLAGMKGGDPGQHFPGVLSYVDTKIIYRGLDMFLGLALDPGVKELVNENVKRFLGSASTPQFYSGSSAFPGVTVDSAQQRITATLAETSGEAALKIADITVSWSFSANQVTRTFHKEYIAGDKNGSLYNSTYTFSDGNGFTSAIFQETVAEQERPASGYLQSVSASYSGGAVYARNGVDNSLSSLISAKFDQSHSEINSQTKQTSLLNGVVTMIGNNTPEAKLSFAGTYAFYLNSYGALSGAATVTGAKCALGEDQNNIYYNKNDLGEGTVSFTSPGTEVALANPAWLKGLWSGTFSDSCNAGGGQLGLSVTETALSWWGRSLTRDYGTDVALRGATVSLNNSGQSWGSGVETSLGHLTGDWSSQGCQGSFVLTKADVIIR